MDGTSEESGTYGGYMGPTRLLWAGLFCLSFATHLVADPKAYFYQRMMEQQSSFADADDPEIRKGTYTQRLDHRNAADARTFEQRYYINTSLASGQDAPTLFYLCGEAVCEPRSLEGAIKTYATKLKANLISVEHRYYGKTQPFDKLTTANMQWLTIDQALEDAATFQKWATAKYNLKGKWIVVGGSYPGSLAAYYRARFPDLVVGALASSGPVMAKENFEEYDHHVAKVAGPECLASIKAVVTLVEDALKSEAGSKAIRERFVAEKLTEDDDFLYLIADMAALAVQYGYRDRFCGLLKGADPLEGYETFVKEIYASWGINALSGSAAGSVSEDPKFYEDDIGMRQWFYQSCTEYGYWQNAYNKPEESARSARINPDYHRGICKRLFGIDQPLDEDKTNKTYYLPLLESNVSKIFFTNGSRDPWSNLGISVENKNNTNPNTTVLTIAEAAHCDDLRAPKATELQTVKAARDQFLQLATDWLK